ncbi:MAG: glycine zipper 2TM domain-containing protein [Betaproteobacteria bacterium]|nr:glycine zipper 2TM domain-containing protein [Betaproteobacteria bacterium]
MKRSALLSVILAAVATSPARAADFETTARVLSATPRMETYSVPHQECTTVAPTASNNRSVAGSIIGGIAGALLGAQVGQGNGRVAAAAVGAGTGAIVGDRMQNGNGQPGQSCTTVYQQEQRPSGYMVTYQYHGQTVTDWLPNDPGAFVHVRVHLQAVD